MFYFLLRHVSDQIATGKLAEALQKETELWSQLLKRCINWINHYSLDDSTGFCGSYPMESDLSTKYQHLNNWDQVIGWPISVQWLEVVLEKVLEENLDANG